MKFDKLTEAYLKVVNENDESQNRTSGHAERVELSKEKAEMIKNLCDKNGVQTSQVKTGKYDTVTFDFKDGEQHYRVDVTAFNPGPDVETNF
jgi:hypothetical protein